MRTTPTARTASLASLSLFAAFALAALGAGCGGSQSFDCSPECPSGYTCTVNGCVADNPGGEPDLAVPGGDLAMDCPTKCAGATPYCNPNKVCVPCLEDSHCPSGQVCKATGNSNICVPGCSDDARCGGGAMKCCGGGCIDTSKDAQNCGACGTVCSGNHASAKCVGGACQTGACNAGWDDCNKDPADGCETNVRADARNCGACGTTCKFANAIAGCSDGCYVAACNFGFDDCDGDEMTGCEASVLSDARNCGGCGMKCPQGLACINSSCTCNNCVLPGAKTKCINNQCLFDQCLPGFADCDNNQGNGCEVDLTQDPRNCAQCGTVCPQNAPACVNSACSNAGKCSDVAIAFCKGMGWVVSPWQTSFPNQPGGSIFCTPPGGSAANDCDTCKTYNQIVWKASAVDACNSKQVMTPGAIYGGHSPCQCAPNLLNCGNWNMMGCMPD